MINAAANRPSFSTQTLASFQPNQLKSSHPQALDSLKNILDQGRGFWQVNKKLITYGTAIIALLSFGYVLAAALLSVLAWVPLATSIFKLVGFGYALKFAIRHLLFADNRQYLGSQAQQFATQILG